MGKEKNRLKSQLINKRDSLLTKVRDTWGVGKLRSEQAKRLERGEIIVEKDKDAIKAIALLISMELAISQLELLELTDIFEKDI